MKIEVYSYPSSTWELDGDTFFCTHDEVEVESLTIDHMGLYGHYQTEEDSYVCADVDCMKILPGSPAEDRNVMEYI